MTIERPVVRILADRVEKDVEGDVERTADKFRAVHRVSTTAGFVAPGVLRVDAAAGTIVLERIRGMVSVREVYRAVMRDEVEIAAGRDLWRRIGGALAAMHRDLPKWAAETWLPPAGFAANMAEYGSLLPDDVAAPPVSLHGDFGFANVFVRGTEPWEIVVIDPCHDGYSTMADWTSGPAEVDIGKMLLSLEGKVPLHWQPFLDRSKICMLQQAFLAGYTEVDAGTPDHGASFACAYAIGALYCAARYSAFQRLALRTLYNGAWKQNYPWARKRRELARWAR